MLLDPVRRLAYLIRSADRLPAWRDDRVFRASIAASIYRIELLGLTAIGKSYFNNSLTQALGEKSPVSSGVRPVSEEYKVAFDRLLAKRLEAFTPSPLSKSVRPSKLRNFCQVIEFDDFVSRNTLPGIFTTASGLVHWNKLTLSDMLLEDSECVRQVMQGRLVIHCTAVDPGRRSAEGFVRRGVMSPDEITLDMVTALNKKDQALKSLAGSFEGLGIPVLTLNLDAQFRDNLVVVCKKLDELGISSPKIRRFSRPK